MTDLCLLRLDEDLLLVSRAVGSSGVVMVIHVDVSLCREVQICEVAATSLRLHLGLTSDSFQLIGGLRIALVQARPSCWRKWTCGVGAV